MSKNKRLSKSILVQLEKDYIKGMRLIDIEKKYNIAYSTIHYHRRKSLVNGKDWSKLRTERLRIVKDKADEEDYYLTKVGEILDSLLIQLESELNNVTDLSEMNKIVNMIDKSKNLQAIIEVNKIVVLVDILFTTPAVIIQPISGIALANLLNISLLEPWLFYSLLLYGFSILLWFIAVYLQIKMKQLAIETSLQNTDKLPKKYNDYVKWWIILGIFSFLAMAVIFILMTYH